MRTAVGLENGLGLDGDRCMRDTPTNTITHTCWEFPIIKLVCLCHLYETTSQA